MITFNRDNYQNIERPDVVLCKASRDRLGIIPVVELTLDQKFNDVDELKFKTYLYPDDQENINPMYDKIDMMKFIELPEIGFYYISNIDTQNEGERNEYKDVTARSYEGLLGQKYLDTFVINMGTTESVENDGGTYAVNVRFYRPGYESRSLLHLVLEKCPEWDFGHIDTILTGMERSFEIDRQDIYSFLMDDVATAFRCFFIFDTENMLIHAYATDNYGEDTQIYVNYDNLLKNTRMSCNIDDIKTCATVTGSDNVDLRELNMGFMEIYNFDYYNSTEYMSDSLYTHFNTWKAKYDANKSTYQSKLVQRNALVTELWDLKTKWPDTDGYGQKNYLNWIDDGYSISQIRTMLKEYGYDPDTENSAASPLGEILAAYQGRVRAHEEDNLTTYSTTGSSSSSDMLSRHPDHTMCVNIVNATKTAINNVISQITTLDNQITNLDTQLSAIADTVAIENTLTETDLKELSAFIREDEISSNNFVITDIMTEDERSEMLNSLLEYATEELVKAATPQLTFDADILNLFAIPEFDDVSIDFEVGNYIWVSLRDDYNIKAKILSIHFDFFDSSNFTVEFGNISRKANNEYSPLQEALNTATSTATTVSFGSASWNAAKKKSDSIDKMLNAGLVDAGQWLKSTTDTTEMIIDNRGATFNTTSGRYAGDGVFIGGGRILFTDDNWDNIREAIGRVKVNGTEIFGVLAQAVVAGQIYGTTIKGSSIIGDTIDGGTITGTDIVGGSLTSKNFASSTKGTKMDLENGTFEFKGSNGKLTLNSSGQLILSSGYVGSTSGLTITTTGLYTGSHSSINSSNTGVYVGSNGISVGRVTTSTSSSYAYGYFKVDSNGNVTCNKMSANNISLSGTITFSNGATLSGAQTLLWNQIKDNVSATAQTEANKVKMTEAQVNELIANKVTAQYINAFQIEADTISTSAMNAISIDASQITTGTLSANRVDLSRVTFLGDDSGAYIRFKESIDGYSGVKIDHALKVQHTCVAETFKGKVDSSSDRRVKHNIEPINEKYEKLFYDLTPVQFMYNTGDRIHIGIISQDLYDEMKKNDLTAMDYGAFCATPKYTEDENGNETLERALDENGEPDFKYEVRYQEFTMLNTHMLQKAYKRIEALEAEVAKLKGEKKDED